MKILHLVSYYREDVPLRRKNLAYPVKTDTHYI
jgi:hypothetical protein